MYAGLFVTMNCQRIRVQYIKLRAVNKQQFSQLEVEGELYEGSIMRDLAWRWYSGEIAAL